MNNQVSYSKLSQGQKQIINLVSQLKTPEEIEGVRRAVVNFLSQELDKELDKMWEDGTLNEERIEEFRNLHQRTPYRPVEKGNIKS